MKYLYIFIVTVLSFAAVGEAVKCYICSTDANGNGNCKDPFNPTGVTTRENCGFCTKGSASASGVTVYVRDCGSGSTPTYGCGTASAPSGSSGVACTCNTDLCNAAYKTSSISALMLILAAMLFKQLV